jgi:hypothetical protein
MGCQSVSGMLSRTDIPVVGVFVLGQRRCGRAKEEVSEITGEVLSTEVVQHDATLDLLSLSRVGKLLL